VEHLEGDSLARPVGRQKDSPGSPPGYFPLNRIAVVESFLNQRQQIAANVPLRSDLGRKVSD
jgi:hypothetical protein